jgi:hypothetical protein
MSGLSCCNGSANYDNRSVPVALGIIVGRAIEILHSSCMNADFM